LAVNQSFGSLQPFDWPVLRNHFRHSSVPVITLLITKKLARIGQSRWKNLTIGNKSSKPFVLLNGLVLTAATLKRPLFIKNNFFHFRICIYQRKITKNYAPIMCNTEKSCLYEYYYYFRLA